MKRYEQLPEELRNVCQYIQDTLLQAFPEAERWEWQCKRAGVMLHEYCKYKKMKCKLVAGWIHRTGDEGKNERGHVWVLVHHEGEWHVLDLTLLQFEGYIGFPCPKVMFAPKKEVYQRYAYMQDCYGTYRYEKRDFGWALARIEDYIKKESQCAE